MTLKTIPIILLSMIILLSGCGLSQQPQIPTDEISFWTPRALPPAQITPSPMPLTPVSTTSFPLTWLPTPTPTELPTLTPTELPTPTSTETPASTPTETPTQVPEVVRIQFEQDASEATVDGSLKAGETLRYVLYAFAGQIMRIYVDSPGFVLEIQGEDGTVLKPKGWPGFWRGELPATQDYFIHVIPFLGGPGGNEWDISLSVLINPREQPLQWWTYQDERWGFELQYSDYFVVSLPHAGLPLMKGSPLFNLTFVGSEYFQNTNLKEVHLTVGASQDSKITSSCMTPLSNEVEGGDTVINSIPFHTGGIYEVAAGSHYDQVIYRTLYQDICYEVALSIFSSNIGALGPETKEFDYEAVDQMLHEILYSFRFVE